MGKKLLYCECLLNDVGKGADFCYITLCVLLQFGWLEVIFNEMLVYRNKFITVINPKLCGVNTYHFVTSFTCSLNRFWTFISFSSNLVMQTGQVYSKLLLSHHSCGCKPERILTHFFCREYLKSYSRFFCFSFLNLPPNKVGVVFPHVVLTVLLRWLWCENI